MVNLKDAPPGSVPAYIEESILRKIFEEFRAEADGRKSDVARGAETAELAATLLDKFGWGLSKAASAVGLDTRALQEEIDRTVREIDPAFSVTRQRRWGARPAGLRLTAAPNT